jgi:hypothetical protein
MNVLSHSMHLQQYLLLYLFIKCKSLLQTNSILGQKVKMISLKFNNGTKSIVHTFKAAIAYVFLIKRNNLLQTNTNLMQKS